MGNSGDDLQESVFSFHCLGVGLGWAGLRQASSAASLLAGTVWCFVKERFLHLSWVMLRSGISVVKVVQPHYILIFC